MTKFNKLFNNKKQVIAMIHTEANPGTPNYNNSVKEIINKAVAEAKVYESAGIETVMIENMHDIPYLNRNVGHEVSTLMSIIAYEIKRQTSLKLGIQILAGANKQAISSAHSAGADFIRAEGYVFSHIADEGLMNSDAGELKRFQKQIGAENILIFTDIKKKHSAHSITSDVSILETAKAAEFFLIDGVIITGNSTGTEANVKEVELVKKNTNIPVLIGSGINADNIKTFYKFADAFIIGSYFKENGYWANKLDNKRIQDFMNVFNNLNN
ncbi:MAG: BtpA/SgcQ family protein [Chlorobi bacterium]|nr:BtpA/SgcQ family protein [Chlorobiota bacterium]